MGAARVTRVLVGVVLAGVVAGACTTDEQPDPAPTETSSPSAAASASQDEESLDRVAVIIGPPSHVSPAEAAALETAALQLAASPPDGVAQVRVAAAESDRFTIDLVELFVDEGFDVVCIVGGGAAPLLIEAARLYRGTRLCGTDAAVEGGPAEIVAVVVDPGAFVTLAAAATRPASPPVGLIVGPEVSGLDVVEPLLTSSLPTPRAPPRPSPSPRASPTPGQSPPAGGGGGGGGGGAQPTEPPGPPEPPPPAVLAVPLDDQTLGAAVSTLADAAPSVAVLLAARTAESVGTLREAGTRTVVVDDWTRLPGNDQREGVLVALTVDRDAQLRAAIAAALDPSSSQISLLRLADGIVDVRPGPAVGAAAAEQRARQALEDDGA